MSSDTNSDIAISLQGVSKKYRLFANNKDRLLEAMWPWRKRHADFWALRDVDLTIQRGETLGILGRNGSGKSTLLQLIAGIFAPTSGTLTVNGRVSALLELGAGFNPEFSGRENVLMNGMFRGLSPEDMQAKMPEIEAFAEVGEFFDRPVKTYSSGMFVRVAFAAAISVAPDILLVDEALAVGDVKFQHKCYNAIRKMQRQGVTVVLVTHDIQAVVKHCQRAVILEGGELIDQGATKRVGERFYAIMLTGEDPGAYIAEQLDAISDIPPLAQAHDAKGEAFSDPLNLFLRDIPLDNDRCYTRKNYNHNEIRFGNGLAKITDYLVVCGNDFDCIAVESGEFVEIYSRVQFYSNIEHASFGIAIKTVEGLLVYGSNSSFENIQLTGYQSGDCGIFKISFNAFINSGEYFISLGVTQFSDAQRDFLDSRQGLIHLHINCNRRFDGVLALNASFSEYLRKDDILTAGG